MIYSDIELIELQAEALFVHDANGRLLRINEPEPDPPSPAPHLFLGRSRTGHVWRTRFDLPDDLAAALGRLASAEPVSNDLSELPLYAARYIELLKPHVPHITINAGPAYYLPEHDMPRDVVTITAENTSLVQAHFAWLFATLSYYVPVIAAVADGNAVAVCFCSRITTRVAEAGVYTEASYRGHGYATKVVQGWAAAVRATGRLPLYSTSRSNLTSQAIAQKLGAVQYGADYSLSD